MFNSIIQSVFAGCITDWDYLFAILLFIFILECVIQLIASLVGGVRR